jgi:hypothetical protein
LELIAYREMRVADLHWLPLKEEFANHRNRFTVFIRLPWRNQNVPVDLWFCPIDTTAPELVERIVRNHPDRERHIRDIPATSSFNPRAKMFHAMPNLSPLSQGITKSHPVDRSELLKSGAIAVVGRLAVHGAVAIASRVKLTSNTRGDLPLMDFDRSIGPAKLPDLCFAMARMESRGGAIVSSGEGYHYYGFGLLTGLEWQTFVGRCLLLNDIVDVRFVGHCLIANETTLRVSARDRGGPFPTVRALIVPEPNGAPG